MPIIGFIDDENDTIENYKTRLGREGLELRFAENCPEMGLVFEWIASNEIECMLVDYKLSGKYKYSGAQLVAYLNKHLPDLPCIMLTNNCEEGIQENLVIQTLFIDREIMSKTKEDDGYEKYKIFIDTLKQATEVFKKRMASNIAEFETLKLQKDKNELSAIGEERYLFLYRILRAYNEVDDIPTELLTLGTSKKLDQILEKLNSITNDLGDDCGQSTP